MGAEVERSGGPQRWSDADLLLIARRQKNIALLRRFFNAYEVSPERQKRIALEMYATQPDLDYRKELARYLREMAEADAMVREAMALFGTGKGEKVPMSSGQSLRPSLFRLTEAGKQVPRGVWEDFFKNLVGLGLIDRRDIGGYRSLLGLSAEPLEGRLLFRGNTQQLMLLFGALYGTLAYRSQVELPPLHPGEVFAFVPLIVTPAGGAGRGGRTTDPYCQVLASAVTLADGRELKPHNLTSAKSTLLNTDPVSPSSFKSLKPRLVADLLRVIIPLGTRRA